ncbi:SMI1/KNR4 family protein [Streptomyces sp. NPDC051561]|uniref:SMI1/KNR4 family protein n=1 Tax=Streptomyces sp. NPDC051561 TaxID=3365658 RepID=UPI0037AA1EBD
MSIPPISQSWWRINAWLLDHEVVQELPPPASRQEIALTEEFIGADFPAELVESLLCHNGSDIFELPPMFRVLALEEIRLNWVSRTSSPSDHAPFLPHYLPFAADGMGSVLYLDAQERAGHRIHQRDKEGGSPGITAHPMWGSLSALLHFTAEALESGDPLGRYLRPTAESDYRDWRFA